MKTWDDLSNLEVNIKLAKFLGINFEVISGILIASIKHDGDNVTSISGALDFCSNPVHIWQIILDNNIVITPCMGSNIGDATGYSEHKNPVISEFNDNSKSLRAAAIVFLMMNGVNPE